MKSIYVVKSIDGYMRIEDNEFSPDPLVNSIAIHKKKGERESYLINTGRVKNEQTRFY